MTGSRSAYQGYTLIEMIVTLALVGGIILIVFGVFQYGSQSFAHVVSRQGVQGEGQRIATLLARDVRLTHFRGVGVVNRTVTLADSTEARRDGIAMLALDDWNDGDSYDDVTGLPDWSRYVVYYATTETPGRLVRQEIDPPGGIGTLIRSYAGLSDNIDDDPGTNEGVVSTSVLSRHVRSFSVTLDAELQTVDGSLLLRAGLVRRADTNQELEEPHETRFSLRALNTFPEL